MNNLLSCQLEGRDDGCNICGAASYGETSGKTERTAYIMVFVDLEKAYDRVLRQ